VLVAVTVFSLLLLGLALGFAYQTIGTRRALRKHPPPGQMIDLGSHQLHLYRTGKSGPAVVLEAGLMSTILSWGGLQQRLSETFQVVSYDRAGLGWSEMGPMPRTADRMVDELRSALEKAGIPPPYILVGHSFGGLLHQLFASRFPEEVAGMVLIDSVAPSEWDPLSEHDARNFRIGAKICRRAALLARVGVTRFLAALLDSPLKNLAGYAVRIISREAPSNSGSVSSPWFFALPADERAMASVFWVQPKFALTIASQLENLAVSAAQVRQQERGYTGPVMILTAGSASPQRRAGHSAMALRLPGATHVQVPQSNHWIMQNEPNLVIQAIRSVSEKRGHDERSKEERFSAASTD
jgi:pimeloyl-ACP methyl ester carboxylesterase